MESDAEHGAQRRGRAAWSQPIGMSSPCTACGSRMRQNPRPGPRISGRKIDQRTLRYVLCPCRGNLSSVCRDTAWGAGGGACSVFSAATSATRRITFHSPYADYRVYLDVAGLRDGRALSGGADSAASAMETGSESDLAWVKASCQGMPLVDDAEAASAVFFVHTDRAGAGSTPSTRPRKTVHGERISRGSQMKIPTVALLVFDAAILGYVLQR